MPFVLFNLTVSVLKLDKFSNLYRINKIKKIIRR
nr:MAG TPA: hypothetical protein [Caudoviricetes sp.]